MNNISFKKNEVLKRLIEAILEYTIFKNSDGHSDAIMICSNHNKKNKEIQYDVALGVISQKYIADFQQNLFVKELVNLKVDDDINYDIPVYLFVYDSEWIYHKTINDWEIKINLKFQCEMN